MTTQPWHGGGGRLFAVSGRGKRMETMVSYGVRQFQDFEISLCFLRICVCVCVCVRCFFQVFDLPFVGSSSTVLTFPNPCCLWFQCPPPYLIATLCGRKVPSKGNTKSNSLSASQAERHHGDDQQVSLF